MNSKKFLPKQSGNHKHDLYILFDMNWHQ